MRAARVDPTPDKHGRIRMTVDVSKQTYDDIMFLKARLDADTRIEAIRRATAVYRAIIELGHKEFWVRDRDDPTQLMQVLIA